MSYEDQAFAAFGVHSPRPVCWPTHSFDPSSRWSQLIAAKMEEVEQLLARELLEQVYRESVPGAIVEFGVFEGRWLGHLLDWSDELQTRREFFGFDSFEGLPPPSEADAGLGWSKGQFAASLESVSARLRAGSRPHLHLIKGWFCDTINLQVAQDVKQIAYARVDGDLYESAVDTLGYLKGRMSNRSILVFDDWTFDLDRGETKAFFEWLPTCGYRFEFLGHLGYGRLYLRVHPA